MPDEVERYVAAALVDELGARVTQLLFYENEGIGVWSMVEAN